MCVKLDTLCKILHTVLSQNNFCSKFRTLSKNDKYQVVWVWQTSAKYLGLYIECNPWIIYFAFSNSAFGCWWLWGGSAWCPRPWLGTWKRWSRNPDVWTWSWWPGGGSGEPLLLLLALPIIVSLPPSLSHCIPPLFVGITPLPLSYCSSCTIWANLLLRQCIAKPPRSSGYITEPLSSSLPNLAYTAMSWSLKRILGTIFWESSLGMISVYLVVAA